MVSNEEIFDSVDHLQMELQDDWKCLLITSGVQYVLMGLPKEVRTLPAGNLVALKL